MVQLELTPEVEQRLIAKARANGLEPAVYAKEIIESAVSLEAVRRPNSEDMQNFFEGMAKYSERIPNLPDEAYTRESFYQDHD